MKNQTLPRLLLTILLLAFGLVGCEIPQTAQDLTRILPETIDPTGEEAFEPPQAAQVEEVLLSFQPSAQQIGLGADAPVNIHIANASNLIGADVEISFNPAILQVQDADPNAPGVQIQPGDFLPNSFIVRNEVNNETGLIRFIILQLGNVTPVSGEGTLASITFEGAGQGDTVLAFTRNLLSTSDGVTLPVVAEPGEILVGPAGTVSPTVEPTATPPTEPTATPPTEPTATPPTEPTETPVVPPTATPIVPSTATPIVPPPTETPAVPPTPIPTVIPPKMAKIPPGATLGFCYRVRHGEESIHYLAKKFNTTPFAINLVNDLYPPSYIFTHQILFIPIYLGHGPNVYLVREGDTLTSIAAECHLTEEILIDQNHLDPNIDPSQPLLQPDPGDPERPIIQALIIPIPYFPPPSKFQYPPGPIPVVPNLPCCYIPPESYLRPGYY